MVLKATQQLPEEFPYNVDFNSGSPLGIGVLLHSGISGFLLTSGAKAGFHRRSITVRGIVQQHLTWDPSSFSGRTSRFYYTLK
jgi:hypothetical protein